MVELRYPSQTENESTYWGTTQCSLRHNGNIKASTKNGIQHPTNTPVIIAKVLAALRSRLESKGPFLFFRFLGFDGNCIGAWAVLEVASVGASVSKSAISLLGKPELPLVPVVMVVIFVVVPSVIVGRGWPIAPTMAVAITPVCPVQPLTKPEHIMPIKLDHLLVLFTFARLYRLSGASMFNTTYLQRYLIHFCRLESGIEN